MFRYLIILTAILIIPFHAFADNSVDKEQMLRDGINQNKLSLVKKAIDNGADVNQRIFLSSGYDTPLTLAVENGQFKIARLLLDNGADVNQPSQRIVFSSTPLVLATQKNDFKMVELLVKQKADVNLAKVVATPNSTAEGKSPLVLALEQTSDENPLSLPLVRLLIKSGADVNKADAEGYTPLMATANYSLESQKNIRLKIAQELIAAGADPNIHDNSNKFPIQYAFDSNFEQMVEFLSKFSTLYNNIVSIQ